MKIQTTQDGITWKDLDAGHFPEYPYGSLTELMNNNPMIVFADEPITAKGVRVIGQVKIRAPAGEHLNWGGSTTNVYGMKELQVYVDNTITSNEAEFGETGINIYPNPAKDAVTVNVAGQSFTEYTISDMAGRVVLANSITGATEVIDVSKLDKGLYLFTAKGARSYVQKVIVE